MDTFLVTIFDSKKRLLSSIEVVYYNKEDLVYDIISDKNIQKLSDTINVTIQKIVYIGKNRSLCEMSKIDIDIYNEKMFCKHKLLNHKRLFIFDLLGKRLIHGIAPKTKGSIITLLSECKSLIAELRLLPAGIYKVLLVNNVIRPDESECSFVSITDISKKRIISSGHESFSLDYYDPFTTDFTNNILKDG